MPNCMETVSQKGGPSGEKEGRRTLKLSRRLQSGGASDEKIWKKRIQCTRAEPCPEEPCRPSAKPSTQPSQQHDEVSDGSLKVREEVLKSDEALWGLYERWCARCMPERTLRDKKLRFQYFKKTAIFVHQMKQQQPRCPVGLTCWADETERERMARQYCCCIVKRAE